MKTRSRTAHFNAVLTMAGVESAEDEESLAKQQRFKAALHYNIGKICEELGESEELQFSSEVMAAINETAYNYAETLSRDLEAFAMHAKRKVITAEDVKLCCRRNPELVDLVSGWHDNLKSKKESAVAPQGDKAKGGKGKGRQVVLDSGSDTDA